MWWSSFACCSKSGSWLVTASHSDLTASAVMGGKEEGGICLRWCVRWRVRRRVEAETQQGSESTWGRKKAHSC